MVTSVATPDLTITKSHTPDPIPTGGEATFQVNVSNTGTAASRGDVTVRDTFDLNFTPTGATGDGWTCDPDGQTVTCTRSDPLAPGAA